MAKHIHIHVGKTRDLGQGPSPIKTAAKSALEDADNISKRLKDGISGSGVSLPSLLNAINRGESLLSKLKNLKAEIDYAAKN